jgi:hypothetical protein
MMPASRSLRPALCLVLSVVVPTASFAMDIKRVPTCSGVVLRLRGDIREGDYARLKWHFKGREAVIGLELSSDGGILEEGLRIADFARRKKLIVYVADECDSVCADVFLAAAKRYVGAYSKIGVHAVSNNREIEDASSRALTIELARRWAKQGVPHSTIGKMVTTGPRMISYLDQHDLSALGAAAGNPFVENAGAPRDAAQPRQPACAPQLQAERGPGR